jgi:DNA-binding CsgD family transcriptional regulator
MRLVHVIAELCVEAEKARSVEVLRTILGSAARAFGARYFLFGMRFGTRRSDRWEMVLSDYPKASLPFVQGHGAQASSGVGWTERPLRANFGRDGMEFGFSCSDQSPDGSMAFLSFAGDTPLHPISQDSENAAIVAGMLAAILHRASLRVLGHSARRQAAPQLSAAELRCLELLAAGETRAAAARALGVKARTVRYYLDRASEKLGTASHRETLIKAVGIGLVAAARFGGRNLRG